MRVCSQRYGLPDKHNIHKTGMHLTNFSVNKTSAQYVHNDDLEEGARGGKRTLSAVLQYLARTHAPSNPSCNVQGLWREVRRVVTAGSVALCEAMQDGVAGARMADLWPFQKSRSSKMQGCGTPWDHSSWGDWRSECFHVLGCDVMFDERGKALLLEVNANPSMAYDAIQTMEALAQGSAHLPPDPPPDATPAAHAAVAAAERGGKAAGKGVRAHSKAAPRADQDDKAEQKQRNIEDARSGSSISSKAAPNPLHVRQAANAGAAAVSGAAAAGGGSGGVFKAGGAEGRRRRQEEEAKLAEMAQLFAASPPPLPDIPLMEEAMGLCKGKGVKLCRCLSHHRPHLHRPCAIDLAIKQACLGGALAIVGRDILASRAGLRPPAGDLARGTCYDVLLDGGQQEALDK